MRPLHLIFALLLVVASGCIDTTIDFLEAHDNGRELSNLEARRKTLTEQISRISTGKTTFTEQEKAVLGPLSIELTGVEARISSLKHPR